MHPDLATVTALFNMPRQYAIPIFQRGYVWTLEKQVAPLWFDILDRAFAYQNRMTLVADGAEENELKPLPQHFLGSVVISSIPRTSALKVESFEVIDGQQRMTTLHIFLKAMYDIAVVFKNEKIQKKLSDLLTNKNESDDDIYKVWPTQAGIDEIKLIDGSFSVEEMAKKMLAPRKPRQKSFVRPLMIEAYLYFYGSILAFVQNESEFDEEKESDALIRKIRRSEIPIQILENTENKYSENRLEALFATVQSYVTVMLLTLGKTDDPQVIFETLNARGEPLLASDLIRNFVFLYAAKKGLKQHQLYSKYWNTFDSNETKDGIIPSKYWREQERQGRINHPRIDIFIYNYLITSKTEEIKVGNVFSVFKDWWLSEHRDVENELGRLVKVSKYYRFYVAPPKDDDSRTANFVKMLKALDVSTFVPIYLFLMEYNDGKEADDLKRCFDYIESFLVRRAVCNLTTKNYNKLALRFLSTIKSEIEKSIQDKQPLIDGIAKNVKVSYEMLLGEKMELAPIVKSFLETLDGDSTIWPDDTSFETAWLYKDAYNYMQNKKILPILLRIEKIYSTSKAEKIVINENLTIEHVLPQSYKESDYPLPVADDDIEKKKADRWNRLNSFGNLTLLTQTLNSSVSNGPFHSYTNEKGKRIEGKRQAICKQSYLKLNTYFQDFADIEWDDEQILKRGKMLFAKAKVLWGK